MSKLVEDLRKLLVREANYFNDTQYIIALMAVQLDKKEDKEFLKNQFITMKELFEKVIKELEE